MTTTKRTTEITGRTGAICQVEVIVKNGVKKWTETAVVDGCEFEQKKSQIIDEYSINLHVNGKIFEDLFFCPIKKAGADAWLKSDDGIMIGITQEANDKIEQIFKEATAEAEQDADYQKVIEKREKEEEYQRDYDKMSKLVHDSKI